MKAKDINQWLRGIIEEEAINKEGAGDKWRIFVELMKAIWENEEIPQQI